MKISKGKSAVMNKIRFGDFPAKKMAGRLSPEQSLRDGYSREVTKGANRTEVYHGTVYYGPKPEGK
jgi:hypothetical protein